MDQELTRYLNDHLAGSTGALLLIQSLADNHNAPAAREFFVHLKQEVEADRSLLKGLLDRIGHDPSTFHKVAGEIAARIGGIKLMWEQIEPGKLGLFEALEMLTLGVHGKCLLWLALQRISARYPEWNAIDFKELERKAKQQRDSIEFWRIQAADEILPEGARLTGASQEATQTPL